MAYLVGLPYINGKPVVVPLGSQGFGWWRVMLALGTVPAIGQVKLLNLFRVSGYLNRFSQPNGRLRAMVCNLWALDKDCNKTQLLM